MDLAPNCEQANCADKAGYICVNTDGGASEHGILVCQQCRVTHHLNSGKKAPFPILKEYKTYLESAEYVKGAMEELERLYKREIPEQYG